MFNSTRVGIIFEEELRLSKKPSWKIPRWFFLVYVLPIKDRQQEILLLPEIFILVQMENVLQVDGHGAVVGVGLHDVSHVVPPLAVDGSVCALGPQFGILQFDVAMPLTP